MHASTPPDLRDADSLTIVRTVYTDGGPPAGTGTTTTTIDPKQIAEVADSFGPVPTMEVRCTEEMPPPWSFRFDFPPPGITKRVKGTRGRGSSVWISTSDVFAAPAIFRTDACFGGAPIDPVRLDRALRAMGIAK